MKFTPQNNVMLAYAGGLLATLALHYAKYLGYDVPEDVSEGLPAAFAVFLAHAYDTIAGAVKAKQDATPTTTPVPPAK